MAHIDQIDTGQRALNFVRAVVEAISASHLGRFIAERAASNSRKIDWPRVEVLHGLGNSPRYRDYSALPPHTCALDLRLHDIAEAVRWSLPR